MNILMGIGNPFRSDDGVGSYIAREFNAEGWRTLDCGTAPENFTSVVRREHPHLLVIVDAADMGILPGEFRIIPGEKIRDVGFGTHQLPLSHLMRFLGDAADGIILIGIQPETVDDGELISNSVIAGAHRLMGILQSGSLDTISVF
jgi:hydrogenase 3 maturation protease